MRLTHPNILVKNLTGRFKQRYFTAVGEAAVHNLIVYNNTVSVALRALTERLFYVKVGKEFGPCPKPAPGKFSTLRSFAVKVRKALPNLPPVWSRQQFVDSYAGQKRKRYTRALERLNCGGFKRSFGYLSTFIKAEIYDATLKSNPCPRLIQPRRPEYNLEVGRFLRPLEKLVYKAIDRVFGHHVVLKCDAPWVRARTIAGYWKGFSRPAFVGLDASRFDQHVSVDALQFEHSFYNSIFHSAKLRKLLAAQVYQKGYANMVDGTVFYTVDGCRASGDMNTALGNVFLMCAMAHEYLCGLGVDYRFINDGDDCGIFIEARHLPLLNDLPTFFLDYGFEMEVEDPVFVLEKVEFCQSRPVCVGSDYMMVRNVHKALRQDEMVIENQDWATFDEIRHATGVCGLALYEGFPVLDSYYRSMLGSDLRPDVVDRLLSSRGGWKYHASMKRCMAVDLDVARASFYRAFGMLPETQIEVEIALRDRVFTSTQHQISPKPTEIFPNFVEITRFDG